jgi:DNA topoisomerase-3
MEHAGRTIDDETARQLMKNVGLGTPATRASIIERLCEVGYAERKGRTLNATEKGRKLIEAVPDELSSPEMTGQWEQYLDEIANGQRNAASFMEDIKQLTNRLVCQVKAVPEGIVFPSGRKTTQSGKPRSKPLEDVICPLCRKGTVRENAKAFYCSRYKEKCGLTLWKNALVRAGGPALTGALVTLILHDRSVRGKSGTVTLSGASLSFTAENGTKPGITVKIDSTR